MIFMAYIGFQMSIFLAWKTQIDFSLAKKVRVSKAYTDFLDIISKKSVIALSNYLDINKHAIAPKSNKQLPYKLIYNLGWVELETFKTCIEAN